MNSSIAFISNDSPSYVWQLVSSFMGTKIVELFFLPSLVEEINFISYCGNSRPHLFSVITTALKSEWNHYNLKIP